MKHSRAGDWIRFLGAVALALVLMWFGFMFLSASSNAFTHTQLLVFGLFTTTGGIILLTLPDIQRRWLPGVLVVLIGFYGCARAAGTITQPWLTRLLGAACLIGALLLVYFHFPGRHRTAKERPTDAPKTR